jgi:hypothetical protein
LLSDRRLTYLTLMTGACIFLLPGALAVAHLLRTRADWFGLVGAGCSLIGLMAYYGMMALYRYQELIQRGIEGVPADTMQLALKAEPRLFALTFLPALLWPLGLLILGAGLIRDRRFGAIVGCMLGLGALLSSIGRQGGVPAIVLPGDLLIFAALAWIGVRLLRQPPLWEDLATS